MTTASACLSPDDVVALLAGELDEAATAELEAHVDACASCSELLAAVVRSPALAPVATTRSTHGSHASPSVRGLELARVPIGARVSRYVVRDEVGSGGMGVVYAAWDPRLDRQVAIKLLRARVRGSAQARARLLREARAIAQVDHPNVVAVYDVGEVEVAAMDPLVFVAMELVDGPTLRTWRWQRPRSWREITLVYLDAARGLQAAHAAGVIHRDFKPGNVMITAAGRVVVLDFGLARIAAELEPSWDELGSGDVVGDSSARLTAPRVLLGTPGYIAPELQRGAVADARSDEWAFCMALAEALCGVHPQLERGSVPVAKLLAQTRMPAALRRIVERGLATEPGDRHGAMAEVCAALEAVLGSRGRRVLAVAAAGGLASFAVLGAAWLPDSDLRCEHADTRISTAWSAAHRQRVDAAFAQHDAPWVATTHAGAIADLDDFAARWTDAHGLACRGAQTGALTERQLDARMACLERGRAELAALVAAFETADRETVVAARTAAAALPDPAACEREDEAEAPPVDREELALVHARLAEAHMRERTGHLAEARALLDDADERARRLGHRRTEAEVLVTRATTTMAAGELDAAERELFAATWAAEDARDARLVARAQLELVWLEGYFRFGFERALDHAAQSADALAEAGGDDVLEAVRRRNLGWTELQRGDPGTAEQHFVAALELLESSGHGDGRDAWILRGDRAAVLTMLGRHDEAERELERVRVATEAWLGPDHPELAIVLNNLGALARERGRFADALAAFERVEHIVTVAWGDEHPTVARALLNRGTALADMGREAEATAAFERAAAIFTRTRGSDHPELAAAWKGLAGNAYAKGELERAHELFERALALELAAYGDAHPSVAVTSTNLAMVLVDLGRPQEALPHHRRALAIFVARLGPDHPTLAVVHDGIGFAHEALGELELAAASYRRALEIAEAHGATSLPEALLRLGTLEHARGHDDAAIALLERSLALREAAPEADPHMLAKSRFALARALLAREPVRARRLAAAAIAADATLRPEVDEWLAAPR